MSSLWETVKGWVCSLWHLAPYQLNDGLVNAVDELNYGYMIGIDIWGRKEVPESGRKTFSLRNCITKKWIKKIIKGMEYKGTVCFQHSLQLSLRISRRKGKKCVGLWPALLHTGEQERQGKELLLGMRSVYSPWPFLQVFGDFHCWMSRWSLCVHKMMPSGNEGISPPVANIQFLCFESLPIIVTTLSRL